jgi:hypothetical protein
MGHLSGNPSGNGICSPPKCTPTQTKSGSVSITPSSVKNYYDIADFQSDTREQKLLMIVTT